MLSTSDPKPSRLKRLLLFDWAVLASIVALSLSITLVLWRGEQVQPRVTHFSWEGKKVGVGDSHFTLRFNRPLQRETVEDNLTIEPPLAGTVSWRGEEMVYTLTELPIYGINYQIELQEARGRYGSPPNNLIEPFVSLLSTRDRALAYIGVAGEERGRLLLYNITQKQKILLTPPDLVVTDFDLYPQGDKILFSAFDPDGGPTQQQLFTVTTGIYNLKAPRDEGGGGKLQRVLDARDYENVDFDLSDNGQIAALLRTNRKNPAESGLWIVPQGGTPRPLGVPGGAFVLSPDGQRVAIAQRGGVGILPLTPEAGDPQFLAGYEKSLGFSRDGKKVLLVRTNPDYTRSLVLMGADATPKVLFDTLKPIVSCEFEPREEKTLYCLKTDLIPGEDGQYREEPFLSVIDLETGRDLPLLALPNYRDVELSMSPDGVALLFDQVVTRVPLSSTELLARGGQAIADGRLWLLPLPDLSTGGEAPKILPEELTSGFHPQWLP